MLLLIYILKFGSFHFHFNPKKLPLFQPNANDLAQEMVNLENQVSDVLITQEETSNQRGQDALLRQKIRNDYSALLKKLDELSKKEKKYEAEQCSMATVSSLKKKILLY